MRLLLDTHALLWWWDDDTQLGQAARVAVADMANEVHVSAATAWEIATKQRLGRMSVGLLPAGGFLDLVAADGFLHLPVTAVHAWHAGALPSPHRDPFDRMLAAQAQLDRLVLVTRDPVFAELQVPTLW